MRRPVVAVHGARTASSCLRRPVDSVIGAPSDWAPDGRPLLYSQVSNLDTMVLPLQLLRFTYHFSKTKTDKPHGMMRKLAVNTRLVFDYLRMTRTSVTRSRDN